MNRPASWMDSTGAIDALYKQQFSQQSSEEKQKVIQHLRKKLYEHQKVISWDFKDSPYGNYIDEKKKRVWGELAGNFMTRNQFWDKRRKDSIQEQKKAKASIKDNECTFEPVMYTQIPHEKHDKSAAELKTLASKWRSKMMSASKSQPSVIENATLPNPLVGIVQSPRTLAYRGNYIKSPRLLATRDSDLKSPRLLTSRDIGLKFPTARSPSPLKNQPKARYGTSIVVEFNPGKFFNNVVAQPARAYLRLN